MWRNEMEIGEICTALGRGDNHTLKCYALILAAWVNVINSHSDGWAYWKSGAKSAEKLADLLARAAGVACTREQREAHWRGQPWVPTDTELRRSLGPMRALRTRHAHMGLPEPEAPLERVVARQKDDEEATATMVFAVNGGAAHALPQKEERTVLQPALI